jgi:hypothetical protein
MFWVTENDLVLVMERASTSTLCSVLLIADTNQAAGRALRG